MSSYKPYQSQNFRRAILLAACWLLFVVVIIALDRPPSAVSASVSPSLFSADRALNDLGHISRAPHPISSPEHDQVRDYLANALKDMGLTQEVQNASVTVQGKGPVAIENVLGRLKGSGDGKAVLVVAHYDSVATGPGASDDGAAVAAILEGLRVLKSLPQLKRDVIVLFSDGEERGLLGAKAFVANHPWAHDVGFVLNFEARGNRGPSMMFETSSSNGWLISHFGNAASHPVANSLSYEIYKRLPNDTDFTVFRRAGFSGLNFAYIDGLSYYHSPADTVQNLDKGSLQHQGDYMVEMTTELGNAISDDPRTDNLVYFDLFGKALVRYGSGSALIFLILAIMLTLASFYLAMRSKAAKLGYSLIGAVAVLPGVVIMMVAAWAAARLLWITHIAAILAGKNRDAGLDVVICTLIGVACGAGLFMLLIRRIGAESFSVGCLLVWSVLTVLANIYLIGASYLLLWPLLFSAIGWTMVLANGRISAATRTIILGISGAAVLVIIIPLAHKVFFAFNILSSPMVSALAGLSLTLLIGPLAAVLSSNRPAPEQRDSENVSDSQLSERSETTAIAI